MASNRSDLRTACQDEFRHRGDATALLEGGDNKADDGLARAAERRHLDAPFQEKRRGTHFAAR